MAWEPRGNIMGPIGLLVEDSENPGLYLLPAQLTEDPENPGLYYLPDTGE